MHIARHLGGGHRGFVVTLKGDAVGTDFQMKHRYSRRLEIVPCLAQVSGMAHCGGGLQNIALVVRRCDNAM